MIFKLEILSLANFTTIPLMSASGMIIIAKIIANVAKHSDSKRCIEPTLNT